MIAVVLARGLGTRMREPDPAARLSEAQQRAADAGSKMMVPVHGRPFLDYALGALADAGISDVALVVAPDHAETAAHYAAHPPARVSLGFVVQPEALGTANAILAVEAWTAGAPFLAMNADNLYPVAALRDLASLDEPGLPAFQRDNLVRTSNIAAARILSFALVEVDDQGYLTAIVEKPTSLPPEGETHESGPGRQGKPEDDLVASAFRRKDHIRRKQTLVSMNCWRFDARIFEACRDVTRSARGEFELPEAVALAARRGVRFKAIPAVGPVLDLSRRADTADVERRLAGVDPRP
jgi:UDP-N-acetylglucosamine diphosphorylase / glucose-1-phosphate thymidylyltransferase / UDP-N-acetylgalactosamine diphosphorylase / glucosamine-1-phosphate N-acetyltransferase / galactosamine-1-phosphate N-acetyltransferase